MIISHKHNYLFVETPRTGTTSIGNELVKNYGGERILGKHSTHFEFKNIATSDELKYYKFTGVRNPLDSLISFYHKTFNDKHVRNENTINFSQKMRRQKSLTMLLTAAYYKLQSDFMSENEVSFSVFFKRYCKFPYTNPVDIDYGFFDKVLRFETLQSDFTDSLEFLGLKQIRPLPFVNVTKKSSKLFWDYYTDDIKEGAVSLFGPFMERFNYEFPDYWEHNISKRDYFNYHFSKKIKYFYYKSRYLF
tara:strand:+ start:3071 stop:3814 length:744 start_codon:yes stop_codon:yes gene_type:complete